MAALLTTLGEVFTFLLTNCVLVLQEFTKPANVILILLLGLMVVGAVFSFGLRLLHRR